MIGVYVRVNETRVPLEKHERICLVVPVPPLTNRRYRGTVRRSKTGKRYAGFRRTEESSSYQRTIRQLCAAHRIAPLEKDVAMRVTWYRARRAGDVPDRWKDLCDALQSKQKDPKTKKTYDTGIGAFHDDAQIAEWHVYRDDSEPRKPRCEIEIWSL